MRLLIAGGRHLDDAALVTRALDCIHAKTPVSVLIHGGHAFLGVAIEDWGRDRQLHILRYPANWRVLGRRAEAVRNAFMLADSRPDMVLALPGGRDTQSLVLAAAAEGLPVIDVSDRQDAHEGGRIVRFSPVDRPTPTAPSGLRA
ncbi:MAG: DUF2493 domain-containing protein [Rubellimicrobium sp.]|nr:DUF2493 domain-containing protein [Rubellimicrobium sp.]